MSTIISYTEAEQEAVSSVLIGVSYLMDDLLDAFGVTEDTHEANRLVAAKIRKMAYGFNGHLARTAARSFADLIDALVDADESDQAAAANEAETGSSN